MGGLKKLKKESTGRALRTRRTRFVSFELVSLQWKEKDARFRRTFISLLLDLELLRQILVFLPANFRPDCSVIDEIPRVVDLRFVQVRLLQYLVLEALVRREVE